MNAKKERNEKAEKVRGEWKRHEPRPTPFDPRYVPENPGDPGLSLGRPPEKPAGYDQDPGIGRNEAREDREEEVAYRGTRAPDVEGERLDELSEPEVYPEQVPGATAATYVAQTGKRRDAFPGAPPKEEREAGEREAGLGPFEGSALPSEQGKRGGHPERNREEKSP